MPPENVLTRSPARSARPTSSSTAAIRPACWRRGIPYRAAWNWRLFSAVSSPYRPLRCWTTPMLRRMALRSLALARSRPRTRIEPAAGASCPVIMLIVVVFPAPLGPTMP